MAPILTKHRLGIKARLYSVAIFSAISVALLAASSIHFARTTSIAADRLYHDGFEGVENFARLESLLEQHRRLVESAPAEVDRKRLEESQRDMIEKSARLTILINDLNRRTNDADTTEIQSQLARKIPKLVENGQDVLFYAHNFAQDKAIEAADRYAKTADDFEQLIRNFRSRQMSIADEAVLGLSESARALILWVSASAFAALLLIGPFGIAITRDVLARLARITNYMSRLAGHEVTEEVPSRSDLDEVGDMARAVQVFKDNGIELLERKVQLERVNMQLDVALNNMTHGLCMFDGGQKLIICNGRYASMYNLPEHLTKPGTDLAQILKYRTEIGNLYPQPDDSLIDAALIGKNGSQHSVRELPDGRVISIARQTMPDGGWVTVHEDVTERRKTEAKIAHLACHDQLTNLPNRVFFRTKLEEAVGRLQRGKRFAVHCLDLDRFKAVNDTLGHPIGDILLKSVSDRLQDCVQASDFVARLGGDEFAIIQSNVERAEDCCSLARRIIDTVSEPYSIDGQQLIIGASIGIAIASGKETNPDLLLKNADLAMYRAKADGRGTYLIFEQEMDARIQARRAMERDLRHALNSNEIELYYQPVVDTKQGSVSGFEALVRWFHSRDGEIPPSKFIPLAEENGLIGPLGEWIFRTACAEASKWPHDIRLAVNLSSAQIKYRNIAQVILGALAASGLAASRLEIEITESVLLENDGKTLALLNEFRSLGIRIVMDDFGTGYSSLSYLRNLPLDKIKIDQSFIHDLAQKPEARAIVRAIISLASALNICVVAEGVETAEQLQIVQAEGCHEVQGFFFSRPQPAAEVGRIIGQCNKLMQAAA
jgi:diguanylate cyclase (GGDEF)-like protein